MYMIYVKLLFYRGSSKTHETSEKPEVGLHLSRLLRPVHTCFRNWLFCFWNRRFCFRYGRFCFCSRRFCFQEQNSLFRKQCGQAFTECWTVCSNGVGRQRCGAESGHNRWTGVSSAFILCSIHLKTGTQGDIQAFKVAVWELGLQLFENHSSYLKSCFNFEVNLIF